MLFSDDAKAILLFLLKHKIDFEEGEWRTRLGGREEIIPSYTLTSPSGTLTHVVVFPDSAINNGVRRPETHADLATMENLLATSG